MACHPNLPSLAPHRRDPPPPVVSGQRMRRGGLVVETGRMLNPKVKCGCSYHWWWWWWWWWWLWWWWWCSDISQSLMKGFDPCHCHVWDFMGAFNGNHTPRRLRRVCKKFNARNALHRWNLWIERLVIIIAVMKDLKEVQQHFSTELTSQMRKMEQQLIYQICILQPQPWNIHCSIWFVESLEKFN